MAHVTDSVSSERFLRFIAGEVPNSLFFVVEAPPGIAMTAAIDWRVVVPDAAAVAALAEALWKGYETFVQPLQSNKGTAGAGIRIQIKNEKGAFDQFMLGKDITEQALFCQRLEESAKILAPKDRKKAFLLELEQTRSSDYWEELT